jgi:hypothetical protein
MQNSFAMQMPLISALLLAAAASAASVGSPSCASVVSSTATFSGTCTGTWADIKVERNQKGRENGGRSCERRHGAKHLSFVLEPQEYLRPTQPMVGFAWVQNKVNKDFDTQEDAQAAIDEVGSPDHTHS